MFKKWLMIIEASQQEIYALSLLGKDQNKLNQLKAISPHSKYLPVLAIFSQQQPNLNQLKNDFEDYASVANKMPVLTVSKNQVFMGNSPINYLQWSEKLHALHGEKNLVQSRLQSNNFDEPPIFKSQDLEIYEAHGPHKCIKYGQGYSFCISQPGNTMWQSYRDSQGSTFYFVFDKSRPSSDPLHIVVVDINSMGVSLTDASNTTGNIAEFGHDSDAYLNYLYERGVPRNLFKNIKKTPEEEAEANKLGSSNENLDWFKSLTSEEKSKYIGRGHSLTDEQFNFIFDNKLDSLIRQYVSTGQSLATDEQVYKILKSPYRSNYLHARLVAQQQFPDLTQLEFNALTPDQSQKLDPNTKLKFAKNLDDAEQALSDGARISLDTIYSVAEKGNFELFKFLLSKKQTNSYVLQHSIERAIEGNNVNVINYLLNNYDIDLHQAGSEAARNGNEELTKKFIEKGAESFTAMLVNAAVSGNVNLVKYLSEIENYSIGHYLRACNEAIVHNRSPVVKFLFNKIIEVLNGDDSKRHDVAMIVYQAIESIRLEIADFLINKLIELGYNLELESVLQFAFDKAARENNKEAIRYLLSQNKAKIELSTLHKAFERATLNHNLSIANLLKQAIDKQEVAHAV